MCSSQLLLSGSGNRYLPTEGKIQGAVIRPGSGKHPAASSTCSLGRPRRRYDHPDPAYTRARRSPPAFSSPAGQSSCARCLQFLPPIQQSQEPSDDASTKDLQRKLQQRQDELDMLQIANETLQAQCKVSAVRVKPSATTSAPDTRRRGLKCRVDPTAPPTP